MDGVNILNTFETCINGDIIFLQLFIGVILSVAGLCVICMTIREIFIDGWDITQHLFCIILAVVFFIGGISLFKTTPDKKLETRYQVTVDDSVAMNEFQSKYEIIEVEGKIYTVRERVE